LAAHALPGAGGASGNHIASRLYFHIIGIMKSNEAVTALNALASEARLAVFRLLVRRGPAGYTPSTLTRRLRVPAPTLSFHLRELVNAGLVTCRREGRNLFYSPELEHMNALVGFLTEHCCVLADEACGPDCRPLAASARVGTPAKQKRA
jgi:ArsR family transcriptional regulator, arsenate/arsenite/antimonite-responsive transcriptional repressor